MPRPELSAFAMGGSPKQMQEVARRVEEAGFDRVWVPESGVPAFEMCTAGALATERLAYGTGVAVGFARSPMLTAQAAWMLAQTTGGRFTLGLGTQVRAHVERRYSAAFSEPGPRMREQVRAIRAIFAAFRGEKLSFDGRFYSFSLLPRMWSPGPMDLPDPPIHVSGVRPWMCRMAGEVADGLLVHPMNTPAYLEAVVLPAVEEGARSAGRTIDDVDLVCPVMTAVSDSEEVRAKQRDNIRMRLAFYGSTPGYGIVFDASGWEGVGEELNRLQREGDIAGMGQLVTDDMVDAMAITSTWDDLPQKLVNRFGSIAADITCYSAVEHWNDEPDSLARWQDVNERFRTLVAAD